MGCLLSMFALRSSDGNQHEEQGRRDRGSSNADSSEFDAVVRSSYDSVYEENCIVWAYDADDGRVCSVCMSEVSRGDITVTLPCFHVFHDECGRSWLCRQSGRLSCPECQHVISVLTDKDAFRKE